MEGESSTTPQEEFSVEEDLVVPEEDEGKGQNGKNNGRDLEKERSTAQEETAVLIAEREYKAVKVNVVQKVKTLTSAVYALAS